MRSILSLRIRSKNILSFVAVILVAAVLSIATFAYSNRASAQDVPDEAVPLSHITPVVWEGSGNGDALTPSFTLSSGIVVVTMDYSDVSADGSFEVEFVKTNGSDSYDVLDRYIRAGGYYSGAHAFIVNLHGYGTPLSQGAYRIEVNSRGAWHIDVSQPSRDTGFPLPWYLEGGHGDNVHFPFAFDTGLVPIYYEYLGPASGTFSITLYNMDGSYSSWIVYDYIRTSELPKSGIESVAVPRNIPPGVYLLQVESDGDWRIALGAESYSAPSPIPSVSPVPTVSPVPSVSPVPTFPPVPTVSPVPSVSPVPTVPPIPSVSPVPTAILTPTATPVPVDDDISNRLSVLEQLVAALQALVAALDSRIAALERTTPTPIPTVTPTPTPQPAIPTSTPQPTTTPEPGAPTPTPQPSIPTSTPQPTATPEPVASTACVHAMDAEGVSGSWSSDCPSDKTPDGSSGVRYSRYYTFTLDAASGVVITLTSEQDTYLYLLEGEGRDGAVLHDNNDDPNNGLNSRINAYLPAGDYTIEATTYEPKTEGDFTLNLACRDQQRRYTYCDLGQ